MSSAATHQQLLDAWRNGDQHAAAILYERYQARLFTLVRSRLSRRLARRVDPDDIILSAYRSFFVAARDGRVHPTEADDLWPLLVTLALRKMAHQARRHTASRRSIRQEAVGDSAWIHDIVSRDPTAEQAALISEQLQQICSRLEPTDREVLTLTLQGLDPAAISASMGLHERTIRRSLERIREKSGINTHEAIPFIDGIKARRAAAAWNPTPRQSQLAGTVSYDQLLLQQLVGAGAFSKVFRALDRRSDDVVAVKFLRRECWNDDRATTAIIREWDILRQLEHPNLLRMRDWGRTRRGGLFLVSDYVSGTNLEDWRKHSVVSVAQVLRVAKDVSRAIALANQKGILHCDLKPSNILRHEDGRVVVCDFGLARWTHDPGDVPRGGTAGYVCPEQISDIFGPVTTRSDVYGLGGLLYALLAGRPPMSGRDLPETLANVLSLAPPHPLTQFRSDVPPQLEAMILKCLQKDPGDRYSAAADVVAMLETI